MGRFSTICETVVSLRTGDLPSPVHHSINKFRPARQEGEEDWQEQEQEQGKEQGTEHGGVPTGVEADEN